MDALDRRGDRAAHPKRPELKPGDGEAGRGRIGRRQRGPVARRSGRERAARRWRRGIGDAAPRGQGRRGRPSSFDKLFAKLGGIVEERVLGGRDREPQRAAAGHPARTASSCYRLTTSSSAGVEGQKYIGCSFPADPRLRQDHRARTPTAVGERLVERGVLGRFAIDFVTARRGDEWRTCRTRSSSTSARAAPRTLTSRCSSSPTGPTTPSSAELSDATRRPEALRRDRRPRRPRPSARSRPTTCSTRWR